MKTAYLTFEILCMLVQIIHSYQLFIYSSNLPNVPRIFAAGLFCIIIDCSIVFSTVGEIWWWTISGSVILVVINILYTYNTTEDFKSNKHNEKYYRKRRQFASYFIGILIPVLLLIFALLYAQA